MKKLTLLLLLVAPLLSFAQGNGGGDGGPRIFADTRTASDDLIVSPFGDNVRITAGGDGGPHRVFAEPSFGGISIPVSNNGFNNVLDIVENPAFGTQTKPSDLVAAFELSANGGKLEGGDGTGGVHLKPGFRTRTTRLTTEDVATRFGIKVGVERAPEEKGPDLLAAFEEYTNRNAKIDTDSAFNAFGGEALGYTNIGKVLDVETADQGVMDRETLIDTKPEWLRERGGNFWVKKDAPIVNYQNDKGEVFEFKVEAPKKEEDKIFFEIPGSDD